MIARRMIRAALSLGVAALAGFGPAFAQSPPPRSGPATTMIVLDGSNSMNARLPGDKQVKFVSVRDALRASLPSEIAGTIGLTTFGARREKDCTDSDVAVPPTADTKQLLGALDAFQPRGFSPVVLAMRTAAKALPPTADRASLILVLDDLASCRGEDPCAVAAELKRQNPSLSIHVVGLGLKRPDASVLACITRQTGGRLIEAVDGPGVGPAIIQALAAAGLEERRPAPAAATPSAPPEPRLTMAPQAAQRTPRGSVAIDETRPGVHFTARLAADLPLLDAPVRWRVFPADSAETSGAGNAQLDRTAAAVSHQLPPGRYVVEAQSGLATVRRSFEVVSAAATRVPVVFDGALLRLTVVPTAGAAPLAEANITLVGGGEAQDQRLTPLWIARTGQAAVVVPPGAYRIRVEAGLARAERALAVSAGISADVEVALGAGRLVAEEVDSPASTDGASPIMTVEADDPDSATARRELYRSLASALDIVVPAGTYIVSLRRGEAEVRERISVRAGEIARRPLTAGVARVRIATRGAPRGLPVQFRIERQGGPQRPLVRWNEAEPVIDLMPGRYRFEARAGGQNAVIVREADIKAGFEHRIDLDLPSASVRLKLAGARPGLGFGEVYWHIHTERGDTVWRTGDAEPQLALAPGRYRVRAEAKDQDIERLIEVRAGDSQTYEIGG